MTRSGCLGLSDLELPAPLSWPGLLLGPTPLLSRLDLLINLLLLLHNPKQTKKAHTSKIIFYIQLIKQIYMIKYYLMKICYIHLTNRIEVV